MTELHVVNILFYNLSVNPFGAFVVRVENPTRFHQIKDLCPVLTVAFSLRFPLLRDNIRALHC